MKVGILSYIKYKVSQKRWDLLLVIVAVNFVFFGHLVEVEYRLIFGTPRYWNKSK